MMSTSRNMTSKNPTSVSVICEEVFEEGYQPLADEINDYAIKIGIDADKEPELLYLAKEGLMQALPSDWKVCYNDKLQATYYYNKKTYVTQWDHPLDAFYRNVVAETRKKLRDQQTSEPQTTLLDISEDVSQLDSGFPSSQGNEDSELNTPNDKPTIVGFKNLIGNKLFEMKGRKPPGLEPVRTSRFEVVKTNPQISLDMLTSNDSTSMKIDGQENKDHMKKGFTITGTGSMFLKTNFKKCDDYTSKNYFTETFSSNVKGILRDSSLTDVRKRFEDNDSEEKKIVRFNLDEVKLGANHSPEDDPSSSKKFGPSPDASENSDEDPWDFMEDDPVDEGKHVKGVTMTPVKALKSFLKPHVSRDELIQTEDRTGTPCRTLSADNSSMFEKSKLSILETCKVSDQSTVKPLYEEDTDSDSKESSVQSFLRNPTTENGKPSVDMNSVLKEHEQELELLNNQLKKERENEVNSVLKEQRRCLSKKQIYTKLELRNVVQTAIEEAKSKIEADMTEELKNFKEEQQTQNKKRLALEKIKLEKDFQRQFENSKSLYDEKIETIRSEYDSKLDNIKHTLEQEQKHKLDEYRIAIQEEYHSKRQQILNEHKSTVDVLQKNHAELVQELERDLKSEEEILRKEHQTRLSQMRDKLDLELDTERQKMRESGEDRLYEKVRCEKRLLEDKYRCLKEKYIRLKTDVRISLERRQRKKEQHTQQISITTTGSVTETDRSTSNKPSVGNSENRSTTQSMQTKSPQPPTRSLPINNSLREKVNDTRNRKLTLASKYIKQIQSQHRDDITSVSQSDNTISNNYSKGKYLPSPYNDNGNSDSEPISRNHENNNFARDRQRRKLFSRMKSASTSRLNSDNFKVERPCTPVENLRRQLQKLEDLEDQFPDHTLETTYHLRYPFSDISNEHAGASSELEFFKHRIHLERDSVRRAKESLRSQRTIFRAKQREIKQHHKISHPRHSLDQLINEERELTEMEVNLHRTRALLGEKVIRLRHLEQSLQRIYEKENPMDYLHIENKDDATTLSDLSSHSSSGFSSTDFTSENINRRKDLFQEPTECIQNLEILNAEIREFLDILGNKPTNGLPSPQIIPVELNWSLFAQNVQQPGLVSPLLHAPQSIPTLADRLETYRQLAAGRVQSSVGSAILAANTIVSQSPRAVNYTTSLVERTRDLRNWLRQAKNEHDILSSINIGGNGATAIDGQHTNL